MIASFARHRVAANLLMILVIVAGAIALKRLNTQFFPNFSSDVVVVTALWPGASAGDVQKALTIPLEYQLKQLSGVKRMVSSSSTGGSRIRLEINRQVDIVEMMERVRQAVNRIPTLPSEAEVPVVTHAEHVEPIAKVVLASPGSLRELRPIVRQFEQTLLTGGVSQVSLTGLPEQEVEIAVHTSQLHELGISLEQIANSVRARSIDLPAGTAGTGTVERPLRSLGQARTAADFAQIPIVTSAEANPVRLGDFASIRLRERRHDPLLFTGQKTAVELTAYRSEGEDTLQSARQLMAWIQELKETLPDSVDVIVYDQTWSYLNERLMLLLNNGLGSLILVVAVLLLFLNFGVAFWVAAGIPVALLGALALLALIGGSLNMISLFALIMVLGIIVDDAIVVGEDIATTLQTGQPPLAAAVQGARRMFKPVLAASLTTIAAFVPLLVLQGNIGRMLMDIPIVVICVIIVSLVECFLILPSHLARYSPTSRQPHRWRQSFDTLFEHFRELRFRPFVGNAMAHKWTTLLIIFCFILFAGALLSTGHLRFTFFPTIDGQTVRAAFQFVPGTPREQARTFLDELEKGLYRAEQRLGEDCVKHSFRLEGDALFGDFSADSNPSETAGTLIVDLVSAEQRGTTNNQLIEEWQKQVRMLPGIERFTIGQARAGPPGKSIELRLTGPDAETLKQASVAVQAVLQRYAGVSNVEDDLPYGREQMVVSLKPQARAMGLSLQDIAWRLRGAVDGLLVQTFYLNNEEVSVRLRLQHAERQRLATIVNLPVVISPEQTERLENLVDFDSIRGLDTLKRVDGELAARVSATVDESRSNTDQIMQKVTEEELPAIASRYGISYHLEGRSAERRDIMADMTLGALAAATLIYVILAWLFSSYFRPLLALAVIPLAVVGALVGHWLTGLDVTIMSLFGLFGLAGIVVNNAIVLLTVFQELCDRGIDAGDAILEAACQRVRPVLLTSLTTIAGLLPIVFETSSQAQFLVPMATSIVFGLVFSTVVVLVVIPVLLVFYVRAQPQESAALWRESLQRVRSQISKVGESSAGGRLLHDQNKKETDP